MVIRVEDKQNIVNNYNKSGLSKAIIFVVSISLILGAYLMSSVLIKRGKEKEYIVESHCDVIRFIESAEVTDKEIVISGWCFYTDVDTEQNKVQVFLRNVEDEADEIWLDVESVIRKDVDEYYDCGVDYSHSGFRANKELKKISLEGKNYEILIKLTYLADKVMKSGDSETVTQEKSVKTVSTYRYLSDGKLTALLPDDKPVHTESVLLNEIFEKGQPMLYQEEVDMYVYQYETKIYWVAGKGFNFEDDGTTIVRFLLGTTRPNLIPTKRKRQENGHDWDNSSFYFEVNELKDEATEQYRVAVCDILVEYPVTNIWTGYYVDPKWVWLAHLTPDIFDLGK